MTTAALAAHAPAVISRTRGRAKAKGDERDERAQRHERAEARSAYGWMRGSALHARVPISTRRTRRAEISADQDHAVRGHHRDGIAAPLRSGSRAQHLSCQASRAYFMGRSTANAMFHGVKDVGYRNVARHSFPAPVKENQSVSGSCGCVGGHDSFFVCVVSGVVGLMASARRPQDGGARPLAYGHLDARGDEV